MLQVGNRSRRGTHVVFWSVVVGVLVVVLFLAWRFDRRRKVTIDRHHPGLEHDIAQASMYSPRPGHNDAPSGLI